MKIGLEHLRGKSEAQYMERLKLRESDEDAIIFSHTALFRELNIVKRININVLSWIAMLYYESNYVK